VHETHLPAEAFSPISLHHQLPYAG
jgi:hypothetical protein